MSWILSAYFAFLLSSGRSEPKDETVQQELMVLIAKEGQSINLTCKFTDTIRGLHLKRTLGRNLEVIYVTQPGKNKRETPEYENRTEYFEVNSTATITLKQLEKTDSDVYVCEATLHKGNELKLKKSGPILLAIEEAPDMKSSASPWTLYGFISVLALLVFLLGSFTFIHIDLKKVFKKGRERRAQNLIYEDMTCSLRRNTTETKTNPYAIVLNTE